MYEKEKVYLLKKCHHVAAYLRLNMYDTDLKLKFKQLKHSLKRTDYLIRAYRRKLFGPLDEIKSFVQAMVAKYNAPPVEELDTMHNITSLLLSKKYIAAANILRGLEGTLLDETSQYFYNQDWYLTRESFYYTLINL